VDSVIRIIDEPWYHHHSAVLVEEKVKECGELQRTLDDIKIGSSSLEDQNKELLHSNEKLIKLDYFALEKQLQELSNRNQITTMPHWPQLNILL